VRATPERPLSRNCRTFREPRRLLAAAVSAFREALHAAGGRSPTRWRESSARIFRMDSDAKARADRRRQRASQWPVRRFELGQEPLRDALDRSTVDERIAMMWPLAKEAWSVAGMSIATYDRKSMPGRLTRLER